MTKELQEKMKSKYKYIHTGQEPKLNRVRLGWHITDWCNLSCPYCIQTCDHHYDDRPKETTEYVEKIANILRPKFTNQNVDMTLYGGEISHHFDIRKLCEIMFKDNNCDAFVTFLTNLTAPLKVYEDFLKLSSEKDCVRPSVIPSYQWTNPHEFTDKCKVLIDYLGKRFQCTCVVWSATTVEALKRVTSIFEEKDVPIRFTLGRQPNSGNKFFEFKEGVEDFVKEWNKYYFNKSSATVTYVNGEIVHFPARSDVLREIAKEEDLPYACFEGFYCATGLSLLANGKLRAGSCPERSKIVLGNILENPNLDIHSYKDYCHCDKGCNMCNSQLIWNGRL